VVTVVSFQFDVDVVISRLEEFGKEAGPEYCTCNYCS